MPLSGQETVRAGGLEIRIQYPSGWTVAPLPTYALTLRDSGGTRSLTVTPPRPAPFRIEVPLPDVQLQRMTSSLAGKPANVSLRASGQAQLADGHLWIWLELDGPVAQGDWDLTPIDALNFESSRIWTFVTTAGGQFFTIQCGALFMRGATPAEREAQLTRARGECGSMMHTIATRTP
jgi:hypothetical protein